MFNNYLLIYNFLLIQKLYNQLNIFVVLVGVVVWTEMNEITLSTDGDQTLTNFLHYRRERLIPFHPNDNAQLITGSSFDGGVVGKALKGSIWSVLYIYYFLSLFN